MNVFLERVKQLQASQNITQKELSDKTDISINTIRGWFSKDVNPDVFYAVKIAKALNTTVEYLVTGELENNGEDFNPYKDKYESLLEQVKSFVSKVKLG